MKSTWKSLGQWVVPLIALYQVFGTPVPANQPLDRLRDDLDSKQIEMVVAAPEQKSA